MKVIYYHTKTPINYWCRQKLNLKSQILSVELTETHE